MSETYVYGDPLPDWYFEAEDRTDPETFERPAEEQE